MEDESEMCNEYSLPGQVTSYTYFVYFSPGLCGIRSRYAMASIRSRRIVSYRTGSISNRTACEAMLRFAVVSNAKSPIRSSATTARTSLGSS
jgi:hypothetical protein